MIATVVQYFHHENFILDDLDVSSLRLSVNPAREPYKYYKNKTLSPSDFFFLENEVGSSREAKRPIRVDGMLTTQKVGS